jgi:hypothetical protein
MKYAKTYAMHTEQTHLKSDMQTTNIKQIFWNVLDALAHQVSKKHQSTQANLCVVVSCRCLTVYWSKKSGLSTVAGPVGSLPYIDVLVHSQ